MRQQDQDGLQLRMLQQQRSLQSPPAGARARQEVEREAINQQQRQRELQYRQRTEPSPVHPGDGPGIRRTAEERELRQAQEEGKMQLQRFDYELQQRTESRREEKARGEVRPPQPPEPLQ